MFPLGLRGVWCVYVHDTDLKNSITRSKCFVYLTLRTAEVKSRSKGRGSILVFQTLCR